jgi:hypothetical protein
MHYKGISSYSLPESKVALTNNDANAYTSYASNVCKEDDVG